MAAAYRPCSNVAAPYRARPGNLVPGGRRVPTSTRRIALIYAPSVPAAFNYRPNTPTPLTWEP